MTQLGALIGEASRSKKPSADQLQVVIKPLADAMGAVSTLQSKVRCDLKLSAFLLICSFVVPRQEQEQRVWRGRRNWHFWMGCRGAHACSLCLRNGGSCQVLHQQAPAGVQGQIQRKMFRILLLIVVFLRVFLQGKDELQVNWTHAWVAFLDGLVPYIKKFHTTGLAWNPRGF